MEAIMSATKILWGQIIAVLLIVLAATWGASEWTAWRLGFQAELGSPWFTLLGWPVYHPPIFYWWWYAYDAYAPDVFTEGGCIAASGGILAVIVAITMSVWRAREIKKAETYGSARWADRKEVKAAGLLGRDGLVLGRLERAYLRHDGPEHVLCFAPTRSGKGVGLVAPSLLTWPGSAIVHDIKGENWQITAGFRARHGRVLLFDPTNPRSAAYNPLLEVPARDDDHSPSRRSRAAPGGRLDGAGTAQQIGQRTLRRAVHRHVVPRPLPRPGGGRRHPAVRLADRRSGR
jgi:type IV secretion system protein VirD4